MICSKPLPSRTASTKKRSLLHQIEDKASKASASTTFFFLFPFSPLAMSYRIHGGEGTVGLKGIM